MEVDFFFRNAHWPLEDHTDFICTLGKCFVVFILKSVCGEVGRYSASAVLC